MGPRSDGPIAGERRAPLVNAQLYQTGRPIECIESKLLMRRAKAKSEKERLAALGITEKKPVKSKGGKKPVAPVADETEDFSDVFGIGSKKKTKSSANTRLAVNTKLPKIGARAMTKSSIYKNLPKEEEEEEGEETEFSFDDDILDGPATLKSLMRKKKTPKAELASSTVRTSSSKVSVSSAVSLVQAKKGGWQAHRTRNGRDGGSSW